MKQEQNTSEAPWHNIEEQIHAERLRLVYNATPPAAAAIFTAVGFLTYLFHAELPTLLYYGWAGFMVTVAFVRIALYRSFYSHQANHSKPFWSHLAILMAALTGIGWGACSLFFFSSLAFEGQMLLVLVVVAYSAGALTTIFAIPLALALLLLPALGPLTWLIFSLDGKLPFSIGCMLLVFIIFVTSAAGRLRRLLTSSLELRFKNEALVAHLQKEQVKSQNLNTSLLQEIKARKKAAAKLIAARNEAEKANMAKTQFLANMSHDIRTPMNGIIGMTSLALETELSNEQRRYLDSIRISADGLLGLLNDILDFSKIEAGQLLIGNHDFNLPRLLSQVQATMAYGASEKGLELIFPPEDANLPVYVRGDELRLRQILLNLLGNAIKFTHQGTVTLEVVEEVASQESISLHFLVRDTGIGIPPEQHQEIFASFSQADSSLAREYGGSGLGLAICRQLVEMMGGTIWLESKEGTGSTFHFTLRLEPGRQENTQDTSENPKAARPMRILVADDNGLNCELAQLLLEKDGHSVVTAADGLSALARLAEERFDLVVMDVQMPTMDGLAASQLIRASEKQEEISHPAISPELAVRLAQSLAGGHLPIIAMTANAMSGDRQKCLAAGMDGYLTKPFDPQQIRRVIREFST